jgi:glutamate mutase epsilon subunit
MFVAIESYWETEQTAFDLEDYSQIEPSLKELIVVLKQSQTETTIKDEISAINDAVKYASKLLTLGTEKKMKNIDSRIAFLELMVKAIPKLYAPISENFDGDSTIRPEFTNCQ